MTKQMTVKKKAISEQDVRWNLGYVKAEENSSVIEHATVTLANYRDPYRREATRT